MPALRLTANPIGGSNGDRQDIGVDTRRNAARAAADLT